jgi:thiamine-phosphate pyrophosphorylase
MTEQLSWRGLYAIVDPAFCDGRDPLAVADAILAGGCAVLQLRDKRRSPAELGALAHALHARCRAAGVAFVVNDHASLAADTHAEGLHLGQSDLPIERARSLVPMTTRIGLSTHSPEQARDAVMRGADLIGFGPIFPTRSKQQPDPVVGVPALRALCETLPVPIVAIGGITPENLDAVAETGVALVAAISAVCGAPDPESTARAMHARILAAGSR